MKIICINGQGGVGKDTFVALCKNLDHGVHNFSMITNVKQLATTIGWKGTKELKDRKFLSDLKDLVADYNDYPFKSTLKNIQDSYLLNTLKDSSNELIFFIHTREPKDIKRWRDEYGAKALLIRREEVEGDYGNHADDRVFNIDYDYIIFNNKDISFLIKEAELFLKKIRAEKWESYIYGNNY